MNLGLLRAYSWVMKLSFEKLRKAYIDERFEFMSTHYAMYHNFQNVGYCRQADVSPI